MYEESLRKTTVLQGMLTPTASAFVEITNWMFSDRNNASTKSLYGLGIPMNCLKEKVTKGVESTRVINSNTACQATNVKVI